MMEYPLLHGTDNISDVYLWLGGTCDERYDWREDFLKHLNLPISYYDPYIRPGESMDWDESARRAEVKAKEYARMQLYVITSDMRGCFSIEEITEAIMSRKSFLNRGVCVAVIDYRNGFTPDMKRSLEACMERWDALGATTLTSMEEVLSFIRKDYSNRYPTLTV